MVKRAKLRLSGMAMSKKKMAIEIMLDREERRLLESDIAPEEDLSPKKDKERKSF